MQNMSDLQRIRKVIDWLIFEGMAESQKDVAEKCGYGESYMSQVLSGRVNLSSRFIKNLSALDERLSEEWIESGRGEMLRNGISNFQTGNGNNNQQGNAGHDLTQTINPPCTFAVDSVIAQIENQRKLTESAQRQIDKAQEQIDRLLSIIEKMQNDN